MKDNIILSLFLIFYFIAGKCLAVPNLDSETEASNPRQAKAFLKQYNYNSYLSFEKMEQRLKNLRFAYPDKFKLESLGKSKENRHLYLVTLTDNARRSSAKPHPRSNLKIHLINAMLDEKMDIDQHLEMEVPEMEVPEAIRINPIPAHGTLRKPVIVVDAGIHAREWVAPAAAFYLIDKLLENPTLTSQIEWKIMPIINPDGYAYSHKSPSNRYWRKNRATNRNSRCIGVDLNRNFDVHWDETVQDPCSNQYSGSKPFSEPESRAIRDVLKKFQKRLEAYVTIHTYGQLFLYPYGYTKSVTAPTASKLHKMGQGMADAIYKRYKNQYKVAQASAIGAAAGGSDDWAYINASAPYSYTFELQTKVNHGQLNFNAGGFVLPRYKLRQAVDECWIALDYMARKILIDIGFSRIGGSTPEILADDGEIPAGNVEVTVNTEVLENPEVITVDTEVIKGAESTESQETEVVSTTFSDSIRRILPIKMWEQILRSNAAHQRRESNAAKKDDCTIVNSVYVCPHMIFWNSMFSSK